MIMPKGKKGQLLLYGLIVAVVAGLITAYIDTVKTKREFDVIGASSLEIIGSAAEAEKALLFIDQSAKYSAFRTIEILEKNKECDDEYSGYTAESPDYCNPDIESTKEGFINIFSINLDKYLSKYEAVALSAYNFDLSFDDNNLIGISKESLKIPIGKEQEPIGFYFIKPSFKLNIDYDFSDYEESS